jgi:hypothetical protein
MYRGSSFLLQKDYKVHLYALEKLLDSKYDILWNNYFLNVDLYPEYEEALFELKEKICTAYTESIQGVKEENNDINVTDTLVSKILLGTIGVVPAYDRYFIEGLKQYGVTNTKFNKKSFRNLVSFIKINYEELEKIKNLTKSNGFEYPFMKIVDMFFWQIGYLLDTGTNFKGDDIEKLNHTDIKEIKGLQKNKDLNLEPFNIQSSSFQLPPELKGKKINSPKIIPTVCNLKNMLKRLSENNGDFNKLEQWEKRCYNHYNIEKIKSKLFNFMEHSNELVVLLRNHILNSNLDELGASPFDIYIVAFVSQNIGTGKKIFVEYCLNNGLAGTENSANAIYQVGKGDGVFLEILNEDGSIKDWEFIFKWLNG